MTTEKWAGAVNALQHAVTSGQVEAASLYARHRDEVLSQAFGVATSPEAPFLLASITKPICAAAVMMLYERGLFELDDPVQKFIPEFTRDGRDHVTFRYLLTHVSGLPDQLPENANLRASHAELSEFTERAIRTPLLFTPGTRYAYSSTGILLVSEAARRIAGQPIAKLVDEFVFRPMGMTHSALGVGHLKRDSLMRCQVEEAAAEAGAGDPAARDWDWNSDYWRHLGAPWGGAHGSAPDVARFLDAFLHPEGRMLRPATARLMIKNQNPAGVRPRGLGFDLGRGLAGPASSPATFGHGGATGTLCWADPESDSLCVVLTTLPTEAADPHPRTLTSELIAKAVK